MNITEKTIQEKFQELLVAQRTRFAQEATESTLSKLASKAAKAKYPHYRNHLLQHIEDSRKSRWIVCYESTNKGKRESYIVKAAFEVGVSGTPLARFKTRAEAQALCDQHNDLLS